MRRITVGVDTGKRAHQVAIYDPMVDGILGQASFPVSRAGFERLMAFFDRHAPDQTEVLKPSQGGTRRSPAVSSP
jgi:hypothetical protein